MGQRDVKLEVQVLWLQYSGLKTGTAGKGDGIENVARVAATQELSEDLPETTGFMIAT
jgi:hypothetical protein